MVTNNDQAAAIAADAELSEQVLSGLDDIGLVGLGLVPGGLRHPFGFGTEALLGADDYRDQVINVREDAGVQAMLKETRRPSRPLGQQRAGQCGRQAAARDGGGGPADRCRRSPGVQSPNVTLYEKFDVGVVRKEIWDGLSDAQRHDLLDLPRRRPRRCRDAYHRGGGTGGLVHDTLRRKRPATDAEIASLHKTLDPITDRLAEDPDFANALDRMRELGAGTVDPSPSACDVQEQPDASAAYYVTRRRCQQHGRPPQCGVWEFRIEDGYADGVQPDGRPCNGQFAVDGAQISFDFGVRGIEDCGGLMRGTYEIRGDRLFFDWEKELEYDLLLDQAMFAPGMVRIKWTDMTKIPLLVSRVAGSRARHAHRVRVTNRCPAPAPPPTL